METQAASPISFDSMDTPSGSTQTSSTPTAKETKAVADEIVGESDGKIEQSSGSGPISFDEFEALERYEKKEMKEQAKKEADLEKAKDKLLGKEKEPAKETKSDTKDKEPVKEAVTEEKTTETKGEEPKTKAKLIKARSGDKEIDILDDTVFKHKVDGEFKEFTLKEAINSYSGTKAIERRFTELNHERQNHVAQIESVNNNINEMASLIEAGKPQEALAKFFTGLGADPNEQMGILRGQITEEAEKLAGMTEDQRTAYDAQVQAEQYKSQYESMVSQQKALEAERALITQVEEVQNKYGIDADAFDTVAQELIGLKNSGKLNHTVTPELVAKCVMHDRNVDQSRQILNDIAPELTTDENMSTLLNMIDNGVSLTDVKSFAKMKWSEGKTDQSQALSDKIRSNQTQSDYKEPAQDPQNADIWSFDQL